jgi:hypothetical protein
MPVERKRIPRRMRSLPLVALLALTGFLALAVIRQSHGEPYPGDLHEESSSKARPFGVVSSPIEREGFGSRHENERVDR